MKIKRINQSIQSYWMIVFIFLVMAFSVTAQNIKIETTGPSGQGDLQFVKASDGTVLLKIEEIGITTSVGLAADSEVFGSANIIIGDIEAGQLITTNSIVTLDTGGNAKEDYALVRIWTSETKYGSPSTNNIEALTLSGGTKIEEVIANGDYWYVTGSDGTVTATITAIAEGTNYLNVSVGANITSEAIVLTSEE